MSLSDMKALGLLLALVAGLWLHSKKKPAARAAAPKTGLAGLEDSVRRFARIPGAGDDPIAMARNAASAAQGAAGALRSFGGLASLFKSAPDPTQGPSPKLAASELATDYQGSFGTDGQGTRAPMANADALMSNEQIVNEFPQDNAVGMDAATNNTASEIVPANEADSLVSATAPDDSVLV